MKKNKNNVKFDSLAGGSVGEAFQRSLQEVLQNIVDPNTSPTAKRQVIIKMSFAPDEHRELTDVSIQSEAKLAPSIQQFTRLALGQDKTGQVIAKEFNVAKSVQAIDEVAQLAESPSTNTVFR